MIDQAALNTTKRKMFVEEAVDDLHEKMDLSLAEPEWSFTAAM